jgi:NADH-quinone oxidoreductase subunit J
MELILFFILGAMALISGLCVVFQRSPVYSALFLIHTFLSIAGLYLLLGAEFIAVVQVILYAGAVMMLFLYVIMLMNVDREKCEYAAGERMRRSINITGILVMVSVIGLGISTTLFYRGSQLGPKGGYVPQIAEKIGNTKAVAYLLFTDYILPFEITSVLLLAAMVGVVYLARRIRTK